MVRASESSDEKKRREKGTEEPITLAVTKFIRYCYRKYELDARLLVVSLIRKFWRPITYSLDSDQALQMIYGICT